MKFKMSIIIRIQNYIMGNDQIAVLATCKQVSKREITHLNEENGRFYAFHNKLLKVVKEMIIFMHPP